MLSHGLHSPLYRALRDKGGLVYGVGASPHSWLNDGLIEVGLTTSQPKAERAAAVLAETLAATPSFLTAEQFELAQRRVTFMFASAQESPENWGRRAMMDMLVHGRIRERGEILDRYKSLTLKDVQQAAEGLLSKPPFVAAMGPVEGLPAKAIFDRALASHQSRPG
jgi:predicted Zn-dependent peptidase